MQELIPITLFSFILAAISHISSEYDPIKQKYLKKEKFFYTIMTIAMILFIGLRTAYNDTTTYIESYVYLTPSTKPDLSQIDWSIGSNPGFNLVNWVIKYLGFSSQDFLMFYAILTIVLYLWFVRKYTNNIWFSVFLLFTTGTYAFSLAAIKQCVAIAFSLVATDRFLNKKYSRFIFWIVIATLFHPYALMFLIAPFMTFKPWSKKTYIYILVFGLIGVFLQQMLGTIVDITTMLGEEFNINSFAGEGVNPFRVAVSCAPLFLSYFMMKEIFSENTTKAENLAINYTFLNAEIMFVGLFGTANYFARLANYFLIFQCLSIPFLLKFFNKKNRTILTILIVILFCAYFYYQYTFANGSFDSNFSSISFLQYLKQLLLMIKEFKI